MADESLTGAEKAKETAAQKEDLRKKVIKYSIIIVVLVAVYFLAKKFIFKK